MLFSSLFSVLVATGALAHVIRAPVAHSWCATPHPTEEQLTKTRKLAAQEKAALLSGEVKTRSTIVVDTYFHCVTSSTQESDGWLSDETLQAQLDVMNEDFAPSGVSFTLKGTTRVVNSSWAYNDNEMEMKTALRQGDYKTINIYFLTSLGGGLLGYSTFPDHFEPGSDGFYRDGLVILHTTVPGGPETNYNLGKTVTHEAGHWFNLYHTFEGGCTGDGDFVSDTPAQSSPTSGCPEGRDSCPSEPGVDPIHNYMDYSYDSCYNNFSDGQNTRLESSWAEYRA